MRISTPEFIALMAMLVATVAISIDAMLPALPDIAATLTPERPNNVQLILSSFIVGMSIGTLIVGPLSDSFGRKTVIYWGAGLYILASIICIFASNLETMIVARLCQGFGAAAPRIVSQALIRDLYSGRQMARISSFVMMIFSIVPALAPLLGAGLMSIFAWQSIFVIFIVFSTLSTAWTGLRIQEPLAPEQRIPFRRAAFQAALVEIFSLGMVRISMLTMVFAYAMLFLSILMVQQIFDQFYGRADSFPRWFALVAGLSASASFLNSMIVMRLGMRRPHQRGFAHTDRLEPWDAGALCARTNGRKSWLCPVHLLDFWTVFSGWNDLGQSHSFGDGATRSYRRNGRQRHQRRRNLRLYPFGQYGRAVF
jgi:DHA1 family bicyclomycin/chloramphenicol resistance-like MFS transporter